MSEGGEIAAGRPAAEAALEGDAGEAVRLSDLWKDSRLVLVFMRHLG
jgi:hypothetical protein